MPSSNWQPIFEKLRRVKFLRIEIHTIALPLKDIALGLKSPKESFPSINLRICLFESQDHIP